MLISLLFSLWGCYLGLIWVPSGQLAYGITHMGPMRNQVAIPIWVAHMHVCWESTTNQQRINNNRTTVSCSSCCRFVFVLLWERHYVVSVTQWLINPRFFSFIYTIFKEVYTFNWNSHSNITKTYTWKHYLQIAHATDETMPFDMDKFKSENGVSVSEEFALFNWSSVGYIWPTICSI